MNTSITSVHRPVGYPKEYERTLVLDDGRSVLLRPVVPDDSSALLREMERADTETIYNRFFRAPVRLDAAQLDRLTNLDYDARFALAVFSPEGEGVGVARYETTSPGVAEVAVVVRTDHRRTGIGAALLADLEKAARERGIVRLTAYYLTANRAIEGLLAYRGFTVGIRDGEVSSAEKDLTAP